MDEETIRISNFRIQTSDKVNDLLRKYNAAPIAENVTAFDLLRRPEVSWDAVAELTSSVIDRELGERIAIECKYKGYIERQMHQVEKFQHMEKLRIPQDFDYAAVGSLSAEGRQKLIKTAPHTLGQASRISGVPPADIQLLWVAIESRHRHAKENKDGA